MCLNAALLLMKILPLKHSHLCYMRGCSSGYDRHPTPSQPSTTFIFSPLSRVSGGARLSYHALRHVCLSADGRQSAQRDRRAHRRPGHVGSQRSSQHHRGGVQHMRGAGLQTHRQRKKRSGACNLFTFNGSSSYYKMSIST